MVVLRKLSHMFVILLMVSPLISFSNVPHSHSQDEEGIPRYLLFKMVHFIDSVEVSVDVLTEKGSRGEIEGVGGAFNSKDAIRKYGEKYRYGVSFWITIEQDGDEKNN